nr:hypothetical protein [Tanacetum cinerariifolium]
MAPERTAVTTTTPVTAAQLKALIARGVDDTLAEIRANKTSKNGDDNHDSGTGSRRTEQVARECNYNEFLKCQPLNFKGTQGVVGLTSKGLDQDYRSHAATNYQRNLTCYECGNQRHYRSDCLELKNQNHGNQAGDTGARGMVHALGGEESN